MTPCKTQPLALQRLIQYAEPNETSSGDAFEWQLEFHRSPALFKGFSGPVGSGKSRALCYEGLKLSYQNPGCTGVIGAPTYPMLRDSTLKAFLELLEQNKVPHRFCKSEYSIDILEPRSQILFRSLDFFERIRGMNLAWFGIDELTYCKQESWLRLEARLRDPKAKHRCGFASWTPKGYDWVYDRFIGPDRKPNYAVFRALQNVALPKEYYANLQTSYPERFYRQEALGEYLNVFGGQAYYAFDRKAQVRKMPYSPKHAIWWALDFNVNPICSVMGQTFNNVVRVLDEIVMNHSNTLACCEEFLARTKKWIAMREIPDDLMGIDEDLIQNGMFIPPPMPLNVYIYGDASADSLKTSASRTDWQIVRSFFGRYPDLFKVHFLVPSSNPPVKDRVNCVNAMLLNYAGQRRLYLTPNCRGLAADFEQLVWKADPHGVTLSELDKSDPMRSHLSDALGYYIVREFPMRPQSGERGGPAII
jgi:phage terminase large subunit